jgi:hypothetical protein
MFRKLIIYFQIILYTQLYGSVIIVLSTGTVVGRFEPLLSQTKDLQNWYLLLLF